jgi:hypothetical protein
MSHSCPICHGSDIRRAILKPEIGDDILQPQSEEPVVIQCVRLGISCQKNIGYIDSEGRFHPVWTDDERRLSKCPLMDANRS